MEGYIAEIRLFGGNFAPRNWATCDGQILAINTNQALFSLIGTIYGGNGVTTFGLPDLRGRVMVGMNSVEQGAKAGTMNEVLQLPNLPQHNHAATASATYTPAFKVSSAQATGAALATGASLCTMGTQSGRVFTKILGYNTTAPDVKLKSTQVVLGPLTESTAGGNQPHTNMQPYLGITHIVCLYGIFPSRN